MRITLLMSALVMASVALAQEPAADVERSLDKLHSSHWSERIDAIEEIDSDQTLLHTRKIQIALIDLLNREVAEDASSQDTSAADDGEEEYSQYLTSLCYIVNKFVDWNDPRQACMMVNAAYIDYPSSPTEAAAVARAAMPCILKRSKSNVVSAPGNCHSNAGRGHAESAGHIGCRNCSDCQADRTKRSARS